MLVVTPGKQAVRALVGLRAFVNVHAEAWNLQGGPCGHVLAAEQARVFFSCCYFYLAKLALQQNEFDTAGCMALVYLPNGATPVLMLRCAMDAIKGLVAVSRDLRGMVCSGCVKVTA